MKPRRIDLPNDCGIVSELLARVGDKWSMLVVYVLGEGPLRFNELRRTIGKVSQRMLTLTLRNLERDGLVTRTVTPSIPPRVDYELTELGKSLRQPVNTLANWANENKGRIVKAREKFDRQAKSEAA